MSKSTDERGRIYLPKGVRERFGERYRIVELPSHVALFPVDEDSLAGVRQAVGDAFDGTTADALKSQARDAIAREVQAEADERGKADERADADERANATEREESDDRDASDGQATADDGDESGGA
jgi:bifunctional DNA-binding transcriptional regulator/antitoxin component of YhaV-PrlF toxin-antitoxin module